MQSRSYQAFHQIVQYAERGSLPPDFGEHGCTALEEPQAIARVLYHRLSTRFRPPAVQTITVLHGRRAVAQPSKPSDPQR